MNARRTLLANACVTAVSAVLIFAARESLYPLFGLESSGLLASIAVGLGVYAAILAVVARREALDRRVVMTAAILDAAWVAGSAVVLIAAWTQVAPAGRMLLMVTAVIVEVFATLQFRAARAMPAPTVVEA